jgi:tetratricopeptide (TPR) repeat protein
MGKKQSRQRMHIFFFLACITMAPILIGGCGHLYEGLMAKSAFKEANDLLNQDNYKDSLVKYEQIINRYPTVGDRVLFEMGVIYASPRNPQKDYQKSLECFQKLIKYYQGGEYRQDSEVMISLINEVNKKASIINDFSRKTTPVNMNGVTSKDKRIIAQKKQIETLEQQVKELEKKIEQMKEVDMTLKGKKKSFSDSEKQ